MGKDQEVDCNASETAMVGLEKLLRKLMDDWEPLDTVPVDV